MQTSMKVNPILIVAGEPYSIFFEILFKALNKNRFKNPLILIASSELFIKQMTNLKYNLPIKLLDIKNTNFDKLDNKKLYVIDVKFNFKKTFDVISNKSNKYIDRCFSIAHKLLKHNKNFNLINGPISKKNFLNKRYLGITEYLALKNNKKDKVAMLIYNKELSVSPITTHLPLKDVHRRISKEKIVNHIELIKKFYNNKFNKNPNIAITGLNPHCESNYQSSEEDKIIKPAIKYLIKKKYKISGPFPADTIFMKEQSKKYDVIVGMYHDQVLAPIKTLFGFNAINITLGLPFLRVSPDHGPNTKMLGKNLSNPKSLIEALKFLDQ